ncbi:MAG: hypothetical protein Q8P50_17320 [Bacillota bacterium]|nr:hypothetical protein [Bacillota bacterium]
MNSGAARLKPLPEFRSALLVHADAIAGLASQDLRECADAEGLAYELWDLIENLGVSENKAKLAVGTKTLHHLVPSLVPPMDRAYTRVFFQWYGQMFQYQQAGFLGDVLPFLVEIAKELDLDSELTGRGWRTSSTKLLDNAVVGYCLEKRLSLLGYE